jgi:hypothetical protein
MSSYWTYPVAREIDLYYETLLLDELDLDEVEHPREQQDLISLTGQHPEQVLNELFS